MRRTIDIDLEYSPLIQTIPPQYGDPYKTACSGDTVTVNSWRDIWLKNFKSTKDIFGEVGEKTYGQLYGINAHKAAICIGSGPSLKYQLDTLRQNQASKNPVMTISCLHNLGYFLDEGIKVDYYLSLDAGPIVLDDVSESRTKDKEWYWEQTKDMTLLAYVSSDPKLFEKWKGKVYLFNCLLPDMDLRAKIKEIEPFTHYISSGGNALGACMYTAKAVMGSAVIMYVGADFCFDLSNNFHSYQTHYDAPGQCIPWPDVFGMRRKTWPSYMNFKLWFDWVTTKVPGVWYNCSEGIMGAYPEGNIGTFKYCTLEQAIEPWRLSEVAMKTKVEVVNGVPTMVGEKDPIYWAEFYKDPKQPLDLTLF